MGYFVSRIISIIMIIFLGVFVFTDKKHELTKKNLIWAQIGFVIFIIIFICTFIF